MRTLGVLPSLAKRNKLPSLLELCIQSAIDNLQYLGDVGQTDLTFLHKILPHCTPDQLHRIETSSSGRDLSSITNELWHKFYLLKFGPENVKLVVERMKKRRISFKWRLLYQAKLQEQEEVQKKCVDRLKQLYVEADIQKQSRQIQLCSKVPPTGKRRRCELGGGSSNRFAHVKGRLMKKARMEFAASNEAKNAKIKNRSMLPKVNVQQPGRSLLPCPQKLPKPPQNPQALEKLTKIPIHHQRFNDSRKNLPMDQNSTTAPKSTLDPNHKK